MLTQKIAQTTEQFPAFDEAFDSVAYFEGLDWRKGLPAHEVPPLVDTSDEFYACIADVGNRQTFTDEDLVFPPFTIKEEERLAVLTEETRGMDLICAGIDEDVWPAWAGPTRDTLCGDVRDARLMWAFECSQADAYALWTKDPCIQRALAESPRVFMAWVLEDVIEPEFSGEVGGIRPNWKEVVVGRCCHFADWPAVG